MYTYLSDDCGGCDHKLLTTLSTGTESRRYNREVIIIQVLINIQFNTGACNSVIRVHTPRLISRGGPFRNPTELQGA